MLVVIAIIGILCACLMPALVNARNMAYKQVCASNLKQQGLCYFQYTFDYRDWLPPFRMPLNSGGDGSYHCVPLIYAEIPWQSMNTKSIMICPSNTVWLGAKVVDFKNNQGLIPGWTPGQHHGFKFSYGGMSGNKGLSGWFGWNDISVTRLNRIKYPQRVELLAESTSHTLSNTDFYYFKHGSNEVDKGTNVLKADGTVIWESTIIAQQDWWNSATKHLYK